MKKIKYFFYLFFYVFFTIQNSFGQEGVTIQIIENDASNNEEIILGLLKLQSSLMLPPASENPDLKWAEKGYLLIRTNPDFLRNLIHERKARVVAAFFGGELVGYAILTEISEFIKLYQNPLIGKIESKFNIEEFIKKQNIKYVEQIAVKPGIKRGIGSALLEKCKELSPEGLIADIFIKPIKNKASLLFFAKKGFIEVGTLKLEAGKGFVAHQTRIVLWSPVFSQETPH